MPETKPRPGLRQRYRGLILTMLSGDPQGEPDWVKKISEGDDQGLFGPGSVVWRVNGGIPVIVAGVRALLMQTLHPGAMAGVHDHSRYASDPLGRLSGTVRWVVTTTFGATSGVAQESSRVHRLHDRVSGDYQPGNTAQRPKSYSAHDKDLLLWVHVVFTDAFLAAHRQWGDGIPRLSNSESGEDQYVREWALAGQQMGLENPPRSTQELRDVLDGFTPQLRSDDRVAQAIRFLTNPPLPAATKIAYKILVAGAVVTIDPYYRKLLGLRRPWWPAVSATRLLLFVIGKVLGSESTSRLRAQERIARLNTNPA